MAAYGYEKVRIFAEKEADEVLGRRRTEIRDTILNEAEDYLLSVNEETYLDYLIDRFTIDPLQIHADQVYVSTYEAEIPAEHFPGDFHVRDGARYRRDVLKYHVPFSGNADLIGCRPNPRIVWSILVAIEGGEFSFEIINFRDDPAQIKTEADENIGNILTNYEYLSGQVASFNSAIRDEARRVLSGRKEHLLKKNNLLASLGVPIKRKIGVANTFTIPATRARRRVSVERPEAREAGFRPEPTLSPEIYNEILKMIHDVGKQFERLSATYRGKDEEQLRDHFLLFLEPNFEGSATGETFNKSGKTDILLRYEGSNAFIAECKFWRGEKVYLATIDQLLSYLTWRDSKSAIVLFVSNKDFSKVLNTVKAVTPKHPNYLRSYGERDETWLQYGIHLAEDPNREVRLAVMLFHIPS